MNIVTLVIGSLVVASVVALSAKGAEQDENIEVDPHIARAVAETTMLVDGNVREGDASVRQQTELASALSAHSEHGGVPVKARPKARCYYNCSPPVGSVTASPQVVSVAAGGMGAVTLYWRWDQSPAQAVTSHGCLWMSGGDEDEAHVVQCERPGHTYATKLHWVRAGIYTFRVAPGNPNGLLSKPIAGIYQLAQTTVVGVAE